MRLWLRQDLYWQRRQVEHEKAQREDETWKRFHLQSLWKGILKPGHNSCLNISRSKDEVSLGMLSKVESSKEKI